MTRHASTKPGRSFALRLGMFTVLLAAGCGGGGGGDESHDGSTVPVSETTTVPVSETTTVPVSKTTTVPVSKTTTVPVSKTTTVPVSETTADVTAVPVSETTADVNLLPLVNPFVGTKLGNTNAENQHYGGAIGNTFPGATLPFGMVQFSPDTGYGETNAAGGYNYEKGVIQGLSLVHASGAGCQIEQDIAMLPIVGNIDKSPGTNLKNYEVSYSHADEQAEPGYYRVRLVNKAKRELTINSELTVTQRSGFGRFTYPQTEDATMILNTGRNGTGVTGADFEIVGTDSVQGHLSAGGVCNQGDAQYTVFFHGQFDKPFASFGTYAGDNVTAGSRTASGKNNGGWVKFAGGGQVRLRIGVSYVSTANAKLNMLTENPNWDFEGLKSAAQSTWNSTLNKVQVTGGSTEDRTKFYTALYHSLLHPNLFSDVNGQYIGFDNKIYTASGWDKYATFSGWDIYRSQVQLIGWLAPKEASDMAQSMVVDAQTGGGGFPKWPTANVDTCVMDGDPGAVIVANLYAFGGKKFDTASALRHMEQGASEIGTHSTKCETRGDLANYLDYGYAHGWGGSRTLEFAIADSAIAQFAASLGNTVKRDKYLTQSQMWKRLYSNFSGYFQQRERDGGFKGNFQLTEDRDGFQEGNAAQYVWMVPQNYRGLFDRMGGNAKAITRLDEHFTQLDAGPRSPYAFMGNEPEHGTPWAYNFAGAPYKSQAVVRRILTELYKSTPDGLTGNDDLGATSAWYVWGALGLYPEIPGLGGFVIGSPLFPSVAVRMGNGRTLTINAPNAGANGTYIQSLKVNSTASTSTWLPLSSLAGDTTLDFALGATANTAWGSAAADAPPSFDDPRTTTDSSTFFSGFETGITQPDWNDTVDSQADMDGFCCDMHHMESSTRRDGTNHTKEGTTALRYSGKANGTRSFSYNKVFDVRIPVTQTTKLSYWIYPQSSEPNSTYVAVDLIFTDGTSLHGLEATDQNGVRVHPKAQGRAEQLVRDQWNEVRSNVGQWAAGKTVARILVGYDRPDAPGKFRGYIDDIKINQ